MTTAGYKNLSEKLLWIEKIIGKITARCLAMIKRIFADLPKELMECVHCHWALPLSEFYKRSDCPDKYKTACNKCTYAQKKASPRYQEQGAAYAKQYREDNPRAMRSYYFKYKYGVTMDDYDFMYASQKGCCLICGDHKDKLIIDHDHISGAVRGLLCFGCNTGIGQFHDNVGILTKAIEYINRHSYVRVADKTTSKTG